jgi:hypothetical protein
MYSEWSFKCRSSRSLSCTTLVPTPQRSTSNLLPKCPEKAVLGLGIHAPRPSLLMPRPSLSSIRTHTTINSMPPSSPLPPLPAYFPQPRRPSNLQNASYPPQPRPYGLDRTHSGKTIRLVPPSLALSRTDLSRSESPSSVYSRSISGDEDMPPPGALGDVGRAFSSNSVFTVVKSPLQTVQSMSDLDSAVKAPAQRLRRMKKSYAFEDDSDSDIDDAATLQARLPVRNGSGASGDTASYVSKGAPFGGERLLGPAEKAASAAQCAQDPGFCEDDVQATCHDCCRLSSLLRCT